MGVAFILGRGGLDWTGLDGWTDGSRSGVALQSPMRVVTFGGFLSVFAALRSGTKEKK